MDPATAQAGVSLLTNLGLPGLVILVLAAAVKHVFKLYTDAQEKRISEGLDNRTAVERNTNALTALTEVIKERRG